MISVSSLCSYLYCPRKLYLNSVLGVFGEVAKETVSGTIKHAVIEYVNNNEELIVKDVKQGMSLKEIEELYRSSYYRSLLYNLHKFRKDLKRLNERKREVFEAVWPILLSEARVRASHVYSFSERHKVYSSELWGLLSPKFVSEVFLESSSLGLRGRIDKIAVYDTLKVPFEVKSGKAPSAGIWPNHKVQIAAYVLLLREKYPSLAEGYVAYIDINEERKLVLNPFIEDEVKSLVDKVNALLGSSELPAKIKNESKCLKCEIREECFRR